MLFCKYQQVTEPIMYSNIPLYEAPLQKKTSKGNGNTRSLSVKECFLLVLKRFCFVLPLMFVSLTQVTPECQRVVCPFHHPSPVTALEKSTWALLSGDQEPEGPGPLGGRPAQG